MNVLSLFDGISCGQLALKRLGIHVDKYFASEIDKYAISITQKNFPDTTQIGDVKRIDINKLPKIDLLIFGSPCNNLSAANIKQEGLNGSKSSLFYYAADILHKIKPKYFMMENVASMSRKNRDIITNILGINPIMINSCIVSALERKRLYWTNIPINMNLFKDKKLFVSDIVQPEQDVEERYYFTEKTENSRKKIMKRTKEHGYGFRDGIIHSEQFNCSKFHNLDANYHLGCDGKRSMLEINGRHRMITPIEAERLQTLPDNYTEGISNTQRYKCIGNGWTVDVIKFILSFLK